jgi:pimeloyl-ACP methyl ester carboxylesterase
VPALILQGGLDTVTPPSWSQEAATTLAHAHRFVFPGQGHVVIQQPLSVSSGCPTQMVRAFLDDPALAPDGACIDEIYDVAWALP